MRRIAAMRRLFGIYLFIIYNFGIIILFIIYLFLICNAPRAARLSRQLFKKI